MEDILAKIAAHKAVEVAEQKQLFSIKDLESTQWFSAKPISIKESLTRVGSSGVIAEFKRQSPSKGVINGQASVAETTTGYVNAGAAALSVLTDTKFFGGNTADLLAARGANQCPILRKDFVLDEFQILQAKSIGADVILLIAAMLTPQQIKDFAAFAASLGLEVLLEVHDLEELQRSIQPHVTLVGVNNRSLRTFQVSVDTSFQLAEHIPAEFVKVSESGLSDASVIGSLRAAGYRGFLIGETFMKTANPAQACADFIAQTR